MSNAFFVNSEYETEKGYADIYLEQRLEGVKHEAVIELKYIKKKDYSKAKLKEKIKKGKKQIEKYIEDKKLSEKNIKKWVIVFSKDKCLKIAEQS